MVTWHKKHAAHYFTSNCSIVSTKNISFVVILGISCNKKNEFKWRKTEQINKCLFHCLLWQTFHIANFFFFFAQNTWDGKLS